MKSTKLDRVFQKLDAKLAASKETATKVKTSDVWLAGFKSLGEHSAKIILGSTSEITRDQAMVVVPEVTDGEMTAYAPSFTQVEGSTKLGETTVFYASVFAVKPRVFFQKATDDVLSNYKMISSTNYLDVDLQKVWERKDINGVPYLIRMNELDPEQILKTSLMAKTDASYKVNSDNFLLTHSVTPGDYVEFFALSVSDETGDFCPFLDVAEVKANYGDALEIEVKDGTYSSKATISAHAVKTVAKVTPGTTRQQVMDYLYKAYGDKYKEIILKTGGFGVDSRGKSV